MAEIMATNADPLAADVYAAVDMDFATLMGQISEAITMDISCGPRVRRNLITDAAVLEFRFGFP
jgi:hypothetical protein